MLADENDGDSDRDDIARMAVVGAVIDAYGKGEIELEAVDSNARGEIFVSPVGETKYSASTVARFLGWTKKKGNERPEPTSAFRRAFDLWHESQKGGEVAEIAEEVGLSQSQLAEVTGNIGIGNLAKSDKAAAEHAADFEPTRGDHP